MTTLPGRVFSGSELNSEPSLSFDGQATVQALDIRACIQPLHRLGPPIYQPNVRLKAPKRDLRCDLDEW
jgi:hypothetical protein